MLNIQKYKPYLGLKYRCNLLLDIFAKIKLNFHTDIKLTELFQTTEVRPSSEFLTASSS